MDFEHGSAYNSADKPFAVVSPGFKSRDNAPPWQLQPSIPIRWRSIQHLESGEGSVGDRMHSLPTPRCSPRPNLELHLPFRHLDREIDLLTRSHSAWPGSAVLASLVGLTAQITEN